MSTFTFSIRSSSITTSAGDKKRIVAFKNSILSCTNLFSSIIVAIVIGRQNTAISIICMILAGKLAIHERRLWIGGETSWSLIQSNDNTAPFFPRKTHKYFLLCSTKCWWTLGCWCCSSSKAYGTAPPPCLALPPHWWWSQQHFSF